MSQTELKPMTSASPPATHPTVGVVVLNWNGEDDTAACLDSLLGQQGVSVEILLIDNASPDGSGARLHARYPRLAYLQTGENLGYAGANNRGFAWAKSRGAEWLLVMNNDTVADPDCLRRLLEVASSDSRIGALTPLIVRFDDQARVWFAGGRHDRIRAVGVHEHFNEPVARVLPGRLGDAAMLECSFLTGCCLLLRCAAIEEEGPFQADYFAYVEDLELSMRLTAAGWRIGWVPSARLAHRVPAIGVPPTPMQIWLRDRNRRRLVRSSYPVARRILFSLWFWPTRLILLTRYALLRDWPRASAIITGMTAQ
jgi:GT2 family glycosyltransferase